MAAAPYGSSLILPISYAYITMMGSEALTNVREGGRGLAGREGKGLHQGAAHEAGEAIC